MPCKIQDILRKKHPVQMIYAIGKCMILFLPLSEYVSQEPRINVGITTPKISPKDQLNKVFVTSSSCLQPFII